MKNRIITIPALCFVLVVIPSMLLGLKFLFALIRGSGYFNLGNTDIFVLVLLVVLCSIFNIRFWLHSFFTQPMQPVSQIAQVVLIVSGVFGLAYSFMQIYAGNVVAGIIGICYVSGIVLTALNYFYHRSMV